MIVLKRGKEKLFRERHHWIFSGAIASYPQDFINGHAYPVVSHDKTLLGLAYFNQSCSIAGRVLSFGHTKLDLIGALSSALSLREQLIKNSSYRLVNAEADCLPGLIVDRYEDLFVIQISTLGMERLKREIVESLLSLFPKTRGIYEKSHSPARVEEGLSPQCEGPLYGEVPEEIVILEEGLYFSVPLKKGQKTGFFLDQREMRKKVRELSYGRTLLNCFCYTGGFTVSALKEGALHVDSVDTSAYALEMAEKNLLLNQVEGRLIQQDAFHFLQENPLDYDFIILDPPAFVKKREDLFGAFKKYRELNFWAMKKMRPRSLLLTFSCSHFMTEELFKKCLFEAARSAKREVKIAGSHHLASDHPISLFHPEGSYLKGYLLFIN